MSTKLTVVVSGSFRRFFAEIQKTVLAFESLGMAVLSPAASKVINLGEEFAILSTDKTSDPKALEQAHLDAIAKADALYLCNPEGYLGNSSVMELGFALALGKPVFCKEIATDFAIKLFCGTMATPKEVKDALSKRKR